MGCHTWFYKKIEGPTDEQVKEKIIQRIDGELDFLERLIVNRSSIDEDLLEAYPEWTPEYAEEQVPYWDNLRLQISNGEMSRQEMMDLYSEMNYFGEGIMDYAEGRGWFLSSNDLPHDLFRKYGYPEDRLFSLEETLEYIRDPKKECVVYDHTVSELEKFWKENPDGMITFG